VAEVGRHGDPDPEEECELQCSFRADAILDQSESERSPRGGDLQHKEQEDQFVGVEPDRPLGEDRRERDDGFESAREHEEDEQEPSELREVS